MPAAPRRWFANFGNLERNEMFFCTFWNTWFCTHMAHIFDNMCHMGAQPCMPESTKKYHSFICSPQREKCVVVIKPVVAELQTGVVFLFFCRRGGKKREKLHPVAFSDNGFITGTHFWRRGEQIKQVFSLFSRLLVSEQIWTVFYLFASLNNLDK